MASQKADPKLLGEISAEHKLKHTETKEKTVLPSPEEISQEKTIQGIEQFDKSNLKHCHTDDKSTAWKDDIIKDKVVDSVSQFDKSALKHQEVSEKNPLPDKEVIQKEKQEQELLSSIGKADRNSLKKVETHESTALKEIVAQEKTLKGIETFSKGDLKHTETAEKCALPTKEDIQAEKKQ